MILTLSVDFDKDSKRIYEAGVQAGMQPALQPIKISVPEYSNYRTVVSIHSLSR